MTLATPIKMPSTVSNERIGCKSRLLTPSCQVRSQRVMGMFSREAKASVPLARLLHHTHFRRQCSHCVTRAEPLLVDNVRLQVSVAQANDPLGVGGHIVFVRDHDDGAPFVVEPLKERQDLLGGARVEVTG